MAGATSWTDRCIRPPARICCSTSMPTAAECLRSTARCGKASSSSTSTRTTPSRCVRSSASLRTESRDIPSRDHTRSIGSKPNCSATGRSSSTASRRATTDRIYTRRPSEISPRRPKRRWTNRTRSPTRWLISSRARIECSPSPASPRRRRRTPSDRVRDGGQRGRAMDEAHRSRAHAARAQSHARSEIRFRLVPVLSQLRADLRFVGLFHPHPLADRTALTHLRSRDVLSAPEDTQGAVGAGADRDVPQRHHPGRRESVRRLAGHAQQRCADAFHDERRGDPAASSAQDGRRLRGGRREGGGRAMKALLPPQFSQLEQLVPEWAIEDGHERYVKRVNSSMDQIQAFYDLVFPRAEEAVAYIDKFDYSEPLPGDVANLRNLLYSLITVSLAVELWKQPRVKHSANTILTRLS